MYDKGFENTEHVQNNLSLLFIFDIDLNFRSLLWVFKLRKKSSEEFFQFCSLKKQIFKENLKFTAFEKENNSL